MLFIPPKCMQQIATLIITFAVYVAGIRNAGNNGNGGGSNVAASVDYESYSAPYNEGFRPSQLLSEVTEVISTVNNNAEHRQGTNSRSDFHPSQIISFTNSDAQSALKQYPPSYLELNYHPQHISKGGPYGLVSYNKNEKQFTFPHQTEQQLSADSNIQKYLYTSAPQQQQTSTQQTLVPTKLHTTPIHVYRDPYTNKINTSQRQYDYRPTQGPAPEPIYQAQYSQPSEPQEYTVQSMLVVDAHIHPASNQQRPQYVSEGGGQNKRPGYVLDEQLKPSYNRPVYSNRYEFVTGAATTPSPQSYADYSRRDGETQTERPYAGKLGVTPRTTTTATTKISYDSHDYPPPSYYKQQTSNFQSPQLQDNTPNYQQSAYATTPTRTPTVTAISSGRPELTSSNYVNKFGNYLKDGGDGSSGSKSSHDGYYKRPSPHYSNDILYVTPAPPTAPARPSTSYYPQANEPIRRPATYDNNYYQYQIGEIPPPPQSSKPPRFEQGTVQRPPPGEYYTTPQRYSPTQNYPSSQHYPPPPEYSPSQNYPPPPSYPSSQHYPPPPEYSPSQNYPPSESYPDYPSPQRYPPSQYYAPPSQSYPQSVSYRPPPPQYQPTAAGGGGMSGLATLASLITSTQQYAPQFANLLLGGNGGGGGLLQALTGTRPSSANSSGRPPSMQLIKALENIARNDDLECVPKVLCNMIASQTQRGQLPEFFTSPAITNFLAGFPAQSPALIYGRAALLGISGGERSCTQTYAKCPKNEYEILYYLNNHRGGFFKFFGESEDQKPSAHTQQPQQSSSSAGGTSLFSLLSALTGADNPPVTTTTPRPTPPPTVANFDITQGIGNFFTNVLSEYISGVEYQRRSSRAKRAISFEEDSPANEEATIKFPKDTDSEDFHDEEDEEDTAQSEEDFEDERAGQSNESIEYGDTQGRVVFKTGEHSLNFFPADDGHEIDEQLKDYYLQEVIKKFNSAKSERRLKFPAEKDVKMEVSDANDDTVDMSGGKIVHFRDENESYDSKRPDGVVNFRDDDRPSSSLKTVRDKKKRRGKALNIQITTESAFVDQAREENDVANELQHGSRVIFPDHYEKHIRKGKILNRPILYASNYDEYVQNGDSDRFVISNNHRPDYNGIDEDEGNDDIDSDDKEKGPIYYSESTTQQQHNTQSTRLQLNNGNRVHYNRGADTYSSGSNSNRYTPASSSSYSTSNSANYNNNRYHSSNYKRRPNYASSSSSSNNHYNYPNTNYVSNNRYGNRYETKGYTTTTPRTDDHNIYVTNSQGVTTHYITPNGRKVYL